MLFFQYSKCNFMCFLVSLFTLFYLILENMSTNVRQFRFPCYILHFVTLCIIGSFLCCHLLNLIIYLVEPNFANWKLIICGFMGQRQGRKLWEFNTLIKTLFFEICCQVSIKLRKSHKEDISLGFHKPTFSKKKRRSQMYV